MISTKGLEKAEVLVALYNASKPLGLGFLQFDPAPMTKEEAEKLLKENTYFDYLKGRVIKVDLNNDDGFDERLYDRDNGEGAAQRAIDNLYSQKPFCGPTDIYVGFRQSGKTTRLIQIAAKNKAIIVAPTEKHAQYIKEQAGRMGLEILEPISWNIFIHHEHYRGRKNMTYLVDELGSILSFMQIKAVTLDQENVKALQEDS